MIHPIKNLFWWAICKIYFAYLGYAYEYYNDGDWNKPIGYLAVGPSYLTKEERMKKYHGVYIGDSFNPINYHNLFMAIYYHRIK